MIQEDNIQLFESGLDDTGKSHIKNIGLWAAISAIASFAAIVMMILQIVKLYSQYGSYFGSQKITEQSITLAVGILTNIFLLLASSQIRKGLNAEDQLMMNKGFQMLKAYFKIYGIILILLIVIILLAIIYYLIVFNRF